jgi:hypothetical protein
MAYIHDKPVQSQFCLLLLLEIPAVKFDRTENVTGHVVPRDEKSVARNSPARVLNYIHTQNMQNHQALQRRLLTEKIDRVCWVYIG